MTATRTLRVGDLAPEIDKMATDGHLFRLADRRDRYTIVYFFPRAFTPNCHREALRFRDNAAELGELGADVVGISTDNDRRQCDFARETAVSFPLVADSDGRISRAYGVLWPLFRIAKRITFVVSPTMHIEQIFWHEFQVSKHLDDVVRHLKTKKG